MCDAKIKKRLQDITRGISWNSNQNKLRSAVQPQPNEGSICILRRTIRREIPNEISLKIFPKEPITKGTERLVEAVIGQLATQGRRSSTAAFAELFISPSSSSDLLRGKNESNLALDMSAPRSGEIEKKNTREM